VRYPFPVDPRTSGRESDGEYRRSFELPADWPGGAAVLRFLGVDSAFTAWLNDTELGWSTGSRLPTEFTWANCCGDRQHPHGPRHQWSSASYLEDSGHVVAVRDLPSVSPDRSTGRRDRRLFVHTYYDEASGAGSLRIDTDVPARLSVPELGLIMSHPPGAPDRAREPWSAEEPRLYDGVLHADGNALPFAYRVPPVQIRDGLLTVTAGPISSGASSARVNRPRPGRDRRGHADRRAVDETAQHQRGSTSHYPPHPDFLALCDEYGLYVICECDFETHGFTVVDWRRNPTDDPRGAPALLDRMAAHRRA